jgi:hypothetical protein
MSLNKVTTSANATRVQEAPAAGSHFVSADTRTCSGSMIVGPPLALLRNSAHSFGAYARQC